LIEALKEGHPKTKKPYSKILIVIEGLYSMEGTIPHLRDFIDLKKRYKAYLFMDEAHSIGSC
jgi:serine palmitoyltransferase